MALQLECQALQLECHESLIIRVLHQLESILCDFIDAIKSFDGLDSDGGKIEHCFLNQTATSKLPLCTGGIFATYPAPYLSLANGFWDQVQ